MASFTLLAWAKRRAPQPARAEAVLAGLKPEVLTQIRLDSVAVTIAHARPVRREKRGAAELLLLGDVFAKSGDRVRDAGEAFGLAENPHPTVTARWVVEHWWGAYVLLFTSPEGAWLLTDPSGAFQLHRVDRDGLVLVGADVDRRMLAALHVPPVIDDIGVARTIVAPTTALHEPLLRHVRPIIPGTLELLTGISLAEPIWRPATIAARPTAPSPERLREAVGVACRSLVRRSATVLLSGGLDSSIVLAVCAGAVDDLRALNFATAAAEGDEARYAADSAALHRTPLTVLRASSSLDLARLAALEPGARPYLFGLDHAFEEGTAQAVSTAGSDLLVTGQGGDAMFFQPVSALVTVDRLRDLGWRALTDGQFVDDARRARTSVWGLLTAVVRELRRDPVTQPRRLGEHLLFRDIAAALGPTEPSHPWLEGTGRLPRAKRLHLLLLAYSQIFMTRRAFGREVEAVHPLLTQPVVEELVRIPVSQIVYGRNDRQLARDVFSPVLPRSVATRRSKGAASDHYSRAALANLPFLREYLLDGVLQSRQIIDREAMARTLTPEHLFHSLDYRPLMMMVSCEAWARYWSEGALATPLAASSRTAVEVSGPSVRSRKAKSWA